MRPCQYDRANATVPIPPYENDRRPAGEYSASEAGKHGTKNPGRSHSGCIKRVTPTADQDGREYDWDDPDGDDQDWQDQDWQCLNCGEICPSFWQQCWNCGTQLDGTEGESIAVDDEIPMDPDQPLWAPLALRGRTIVGLSVLLVVTLYLAQRQPAVVLFLTLLGIVAAPIFGRAVPELKRWWKQLWKA